MVSTAAIKTRKASSYLQQLCKHFGHKTEAEFSPTAGWIKFNFGRAELVAENETLTMRAHAETADNLDRLKHVLASHLERFAFREDLDINWNG